MDVTSELEHAVAQLEPGGRLVRATELVGGVSADVFGLDIATSTGATRRVVYRRHRSPGFKQQTQSVTGKEFGVLVALHRHGLAVPEPYVCGDVGPAADPFMLIEWIDGSTEVAAGDLPAALDQMARFLVGLHALDPRALKLPTLEPVENPLTSIDVYLPPTEAGERVRAMIASGSLVDDPNPSVVVHGDYWPGNVMWRDGRLVAVIDWEDACLGDPLADVATARVELLCRFGAEAMERFTSRYLTLAGDTLGWLRLDSLSIWELYVSASALATMGEWGLEPAEEARRRQRTQEFFERAAAELG